MTILSRQRLDEIRTDCEHHASSDLVKVQQVELTKLLWEVQQWRQGGVTEELLRAHDGCIRIGKGCMIVAEPPNAG